MEGTFKVIVAGGREFSNFDLLRDKLDNILSSKSTIEIVSGKAKGADKLGEIYAKMHDYPVAEFPADWDGLGKKAGPVRNKQMADYADALVAFWDGTSSGTRNMIDEATRKGLLVRVIKY